MVERFGSHAAPAPTVSGPSGKTDAELLQHIVLPMVRERSREAGDAWDQASNALEAAISAYVSAPTSRDDVLEEAAKIADELGVRWIGNRIRALTGEKP